MKINKQRLFFEVIIIHLFAWWGIRTLSSQMPLMHLFDANTIAWFAIRIARAVLTVAVVLAWARWRKISLQDVGIGGHHFWRNFSIAFGCDAALWLAVVMLGGIPLVSPNPISNEARALAAITALVDVLAQQLPTFGLAWCSYTFAHLIGSSLPVFATAVIGLLFGVLMLRTKTWGQGWEYTPAFTLCEPSLDGVRNSIAIVLHE